MLKIWTEDSLTKIFPDDRPESGQKRIEILGARGAVESGQFAILADEDVLDFKITIKPPRKGREALDGIKWRRVDFVPVSRPAWYVDSSIRLKNYPAFFPDPLIEQEGKDSLWWKSNHTKIITLPAGMTLPIWITIRIPEKASPGRYEGEITVKTERGNGRVPLIVNVSPAICPKKRTLKLTQWFSASLIAKAGKVQLWSEEFWNILKNWAENLADHRANVILTPLTSLIDLSRDSNDSNHFKRICDSLSQGKLKADFRKFDRWIDVFKKAGAIGYIEGGHLGGRQSSWKSNFAIGEFKIKAKDGKEELISKVPVESPKAKKFLSEYLPLLFNHIKKKGLESIYFQHLADEPIPDNADSYRILADMAKKHMPGIKRIDATMADEKLAGTVEIWCPQSQEAENQNEFFKQRQRMGEEVWHYTCLAPQGLFPNRFISMPLIATRMLHWFNYTAGITGYLHWGFNHWNGFSTPETPYADTESTTTIGFRNLPTGDTHLVYPGPNGTVMDSIRHEILLEGVQDYEMLKILDERKPAEARSIATSVLPSLTRYEKNVKKFRKARAELLKAVAELK